MRFVSKHPKLSLGTVVKEKFVLALDGQRDKTTDSVAIFFDQLGLTLADIAYAKSVWPEKSFTGRWLDADGITLQPIEERIGVYDTVEAQQRNGWSDEVRAKVEAYMLRSESLGPDFVQVEQAVETGAPWPNYESTHHFRIAGLAEELGLVEKTLDWERSRTPARPSVIKGLEEKLAAPAAETVEDDGPLVAA